MTTTTTPDTHVVVVVPGFIQGAAAVDLKTRSLLQHLDDAGLTPVLAPLPGRGAPPGAGDARFHDYVVLVDDVVHHHQRAGHRVSVIGHSLGGLIASALPIATQLQLHRRVVVASPLLPSVTTPLARVVDPLLLPLANGLHRAGVPFPGALFGQAFHLARRGMNLPWMRHPLQVWAPGAFDDDEWRDVLQEGFVRDSFGVLADLLHLKHSDGRRTLGLDVDERLTFAGAPPTLVIAGDLDGIAPQASVEQLFHRLGSHDKEFVVAGKQTAGVRFGHVDLLIGRHAPAFVWPRLLRFLVDDRRGSR